MIKGNWIIENSNTAVLNTLRNIDYNSVKETNDIVVLNSVDFIENKDLERLKDNYYNRGYAIFETNSMKGGDLLHLIAKHLKLGSAYVPDHYKNHPSMYRKDKLNEIVAGNLSNHKAFNENNEQQLHSDGTLHQIGYIKTTLLFCETAAEEGGDTIIFDSVRAFLKLFQENAYLALSMLNNNALRRVADIGFTNSYVGPAYSVVEGDLITRFTLDHTADWEYGFSKVEKLKEAYEYLKNLASIESEYFKKFRLKSGQGIIIANDKVAHGRTKFRNSNLQKRKMIRGLYLRRPTK